MPRLIASPGTICPPVRGTRTFRRALHPIGGLLIVLTCFGAVASATAQGPRRAASWDLPRGRFYVGQGIDAWVVVIAGASPPALQVGTSPAVEVSRLSGMRVRPIAASEIGDVVDRTNEYRIPVRIIPKKSGRIALPGSKVVSDGAPLDLPSATLAVLNPPIEGRPGTFLGGIGRIDATAEARPEAVSVGEEFEYRIRLEGPGSIGSTAEPRLAGLDRLGLGIRVEPLPSEMTAEPPARTLRFRLRPTISGSRSLPTFLVSWFDPVASRYMTSATRAVPIRVVDVPELDLEAVRMPETSDRAHPARVWAITSGVAGLLAAAGLVLFARYRRRSRRVASAHRIAEALARRLAAIADPRAAAEAVPPSLAEFLDRVAGRPPGVLTPTEAEAWITELSGDSDLASASGRLIATCDGILYGDEPLDGEDDPVATACRILRTLARIDLAEKPREAPGTA